MSKLDEITQKSQMASEDDGVNQQFVPDIQDADKSDQSTNAEPQPPTLAVENTQKVSATRKRSMAEKYNDPIIGAAIIFCDVHGSKMIEPSEVVDTMSAQVHALKSKGMDVIEEMLFSQAMALQAIFVKAASQIGRAAHLSSLQTWSSIALKAQNQYRQTLLALVDIKSPRQTAFIKQQNNAVTQQVNNQPTANSEKFSPYENELLEAPHVTVDTRTAATPISAHPAVEAVATLNRAKNPGGKGY